jgi:predicted nuclease of predicted toxin-antitoxin system
VKFLLDESADYPIAAHLAARGHDVTAVAHDYPQALADRRVLEIAHEEGRVLITNDRDFGELVFRQKLPHSGVVLLRLGKEDLATKLAAIDRILARHGVDLTGFIVATDRGIRIRKPR